MNTSVDRLKETCKQSYLNDLQPKEATKNEKLKTFLSKLQDLDINIGEPFARSAIKAFNDASDIPSARHLLSRELTTEGLYTPVFNFTQSASFVKFYGQLAILQKTNDQLTLQQVATAFQEVYDLTDFESTISTWTGCTPVYCGLPSCHYDDEITVSPHRILTLMKLHGESWLEQAKELQAQASQHADNDKWSCLYKKLCAFAIFTLLPASLLLATISTGFNSKLTGCAVGFGVAWLAIGVVLLFSLDYGFYCRSNSNNDYSELTFAKTEDQETYGTT